MGIPFDPSRRGRVTAGTPHKVQIVQKIGLPVDSNPTGASPVAPRRDNRIEHVKYLAKQPVQIQPLIYCAVIIHRENFLPPLDHFPENGADFLFPPLIVIVKIPSDVRFHNRLV
jgi:hypothetical protein